MNTYVKHIMGKAWVAAIAALACASCSDRDEHFEPEAASGTTLWETISTESDLSNFATVLKGWSSWTSSRCRVWMRR